MFAIPFPAMDTSRRCMLPQLPMFVLRFTPEDLQGWPGRVLLLMAEFLEPLTP